VSSSWAAASADWASHSRGYVAWWIWGIAHIYFLIGIRNRLAVALSGLWIYLTGTRGACLITPGEQRAPDEPPVAR
jgi:NADH dehydrogenase